MIFFLCNSYFRSSNILYSYIHSFKTPKRDKNLIPTHTSKLSEEENQPKENDIPNLLGFSSVDYKRIILFVFRSWVRYSKLTEGYKTNKHLLACWYIGGRILLWSERCPQNVTVALDALLISQLLIQFLDNLSTSSIIPIIYQPPEGVYLLNIHQEYQLLKLIQDKFNVQKHVLTHHTL